jgi:competence protein ComEC
MQQLQHYLPDRATQSLLQAMLAGDETGMDADLRNAYAQTGIIHIVSISGSHVAVLFSIVSGLLWWLRNKKYAALKYLIALLPVWFYVLMAGSPPSAIRAAMMFTILAGGIWLQRNPQPLNTLLAAAFLLLCANPDWLFSVGFQLSFIAVLSLIIFYQPIARLVRSKYWFVNKLWQGIAASIAAEILIAPLVIWYFHSFPLMFIVANLLAAVCMGALLVAGMLLLACTPFPALAGFIGTCCIACTQWFNRIIYGLQSLSPASFNFLRLSGWETTLLYLCIIGISTWLMKQNRKAVFVALSAACVLMAQLCLDEWNALHQQQLVVYNTGRNNQAEMISGKYFSVLIKNDSSYNNAYAPNALHTRLHAWREKPAGGSLIENNGIKVLLLNEQLQYSDSSRFPVDILVIAAKLKQLSFTDIIRCYQPKQIIFPSNQSKWYAARWKDSCTAHHIAFHDVAANGAFVLNLSGKQKTVTWL